MTPLAIIEIYVGLVRVLEPTGPALNVVAFLANSVAAFASLVSVAVMIAGAVAALRGEETRYAVTVPPWNS